MYRRPMRGVRGLSNGFGERRMCVNRPDQLFDRALQPERQGRLSDELGRARLHDGIGNGALKGERIDPEFADPDYPEPVTFALLDIYDATSDTWVTAGAFVGRWDGKDLVQLSDGRLLLAGWGIHIVTLPTTRARSMDPSGSGIGRLTPHGSGGPSAS